MRPRALFRPATAALLAVVLGCAPTSSPIDGSYDVYVVGVPAATLEVAGGTYRIRKKDLSANEWGEWVSAPAESVAGDDRFRLWGAVAGLPGQLRSLGRIDWGSLDAVGWPDASRIWLRYEGGEGAGSGHAWSPDEVPTRWYVKDGSLPMDLVLGTGNRLLAAFDVRGDVVVVRSGHEELTTVAAWRDDAVSQPRFGYRLHERTMVRGDDGVGLSTLVYLPDGAGADGPFPTILIRTPYGISELIQGYWHYAVRGFAVVLQAARGTAYWDPENRSEGRWEPMINEPADGARALEWITEQPWSDGQICMQGGSYVGYTQWTASMSKNPALRCLVPESSMGTAFSDQPYMGGGMVEGMAYYMFWMLDKPVREELSWTEILHHRPLTELDELATGEDVPEWDALLRNWRNGEYWEGQNWYADPGTRAFGAFQISGWFDDDFPGTRANWELMQQRGEGPQRLLLGPWRHGYNIDRALNGFSFGPEAVRDDVWLEKQRWYDHFLKDANGGVAERRVDYFVLGENRWRGATSWPPEEAVEESWYFHSTGEAGRFVHDGRLSRDLPEVAQAPDRYRYDPADPPSNWHSFDLMESWEDVQSFPYDFKDIEGRPDVVTYTSPVLDEDVTIAGDVKVVLYASADVRDTDWWAHLSDVYPDNRSVRLTVGMLRARFRHLDDPDHQITGSNFGSEVLLSGDPDEVVRYEIAIPSIANTFRAGHRIRVAIMNALDNYSFPNSNTGGDEATVTATVPGDMAIHHGPGRASHVVLNRIPAGPPGGTP